MKRNLLQKVMAYMVIASFLFSSGCSKLTTENYDKLEMGMDYKEVVEIFGEADECDGALGIKNCTWGTDKKHIKVNFIKDKVVLFSGKGL